MKLHFYEIKVLATREADAGDISVMSRGACEASNGIHHVGTTIHNRHSVHGDGRQGVAAIIVASLKDKEDMIPEIDKWAGFFARRYGLPVLDAKEFGETTLNMKDSDETIGEFIDNFKGVDDEGFVVKGNNDESEEFTIKGVNDE